MRREFPCLPLIGRDGKVISVHRGYSEESIDSIIAETNAALAIPAQQKVAARLQ